MGDDRWLGKLRQEAGGVRVGRCAVGPDAVLVPLKVLSISSNAARRRELCRSVRLTWRGLWLVMNSYE